MYKFLLRNQSDCAEGDFVHAIDDNIRFEVKNETIFYQYAPYIIGLLFLDAGKGGI
jgi:hypothetical protein